MLCTKTPGRTASMRSFTTRMPAQQVSPMPCHRTTGTGDSESSPSAPPVAGTRTTLRTSIAHSIDMTKPCQLSMRVGAPALIVGFEHISAVRLTLSSPAALLPLWRPCSLGRLRMRLLVSLVLIAQSMAQKSCFVGVYGWTCTPSDFDSALVAMDAIQAAAVANANTPTRPSAITTTTQPDCDADPCAEGCTPCVASCVAAGFEARVVLLMHARLRPSGLLASLTLACCLRRRSLPPLPRTCSTTTWTRSVAATARREVARRPLRAFTERKPPSAGHAHRRTSPLCRSGYVPTRRCSSGEPCRYDGEMPLNLPIAYRHLFHCANV